MSDAPQPYQWDFDLPSMELLSQGYLSFSVGVFQWLPRARGRGLKRSPAAARVTGYTAEPDSVFKKAAELCESLNAQAAQTAARPKWLRKQYVVPRPTELIIERRRTDFTAGQVRAMRIQVAKRLLIPAGFIVAQGAAYIRRCENQIHLIQFDNFGHQVRVNLGFHYTFIPPRSGARSVPLRDFDFLDCIARTDIASFLDDRNDGSFDYGNDRARLITHLETCATTCLDGFKTAAKAWHDPRVLVRREQTKALRGWNDPIDALAKGWIELHSGRLAEAKKQLAQSLSNYEEQVLVKHLQLQKCISEMERAANDGVQYTLPDRVAD